MFCDDVACDNGEVFVPLFCLFHEFRVSKNAFFFHFLFTFSRAHLKRAFARAYNITFFFCVRTRARKSHALLSSIDLSSIDLYR